MIANARMYSVTPASSDACETNVKHVFWSALP
jgi:hypothetical protein